VVREHRRARCDSARHPRPCAGTESVEAPPRMGANDVRKAGQEKVWALGRPAGDGRALSAYFGPAGDRRQATCTSYTAGRQRCFSKGK
jgi:hypothetical protein